MTTAREVWAVPGQQRAVEVLRGAVARGEVGHAWAFTGPVGVGQTQATRALVAALNCPQPRQAGEPCGSCSVCDRCARGAYGAYTEFVPTGAFHRVDEVREQWLRSASRAAGEGQWKVLRIRDADRMNEASANAFLKGLEEPPPRTVWVLDIADPDELPDTILSRCRTLRFAALGPAELEREAERLGIPPADRALAVRAALGSPATLERLAVPPRPAEGKQLAWPGGLDDLRRHRSIPRRLRTDGPGYSLIAAHEIAGKAKAGSPPTEIERRTAALKQAAKDEIALLNERYGDELPRGLAKQLDDRRAREEREARTRVVADALDDLLTWYRDCLLVASGGDPDEAIHLDDPEGLRADAEALGAARIVEAIDRVLATREMLERNVGQALALEALFMELSALTLSR